MSKGGSCYSADDDDAVADCTYDGSGEGRIREGGRASERTAERGYTKPFCTAQAEKLPQKDDATHLRLRT
jgi:hypothetical protein